MTTKRKMKFMALARVSSREQEQEGFSLEVQESGFHLFAENQGGIVDPIFRIAETATKSEERKKFRELVAFAKKNAKDYDGLLFWKIDRAARNLKDFVELEEIEARYGLPFIAITQPVQNTPTGRMMRRTLATIAAFTTEQQSLDVTDGIARRVAEGWFPSNPPFGYKTIRPHKRSLVVLHPLNSLKVMRIFELRATLWLTVEEIVQRLFEEGLFYSDSKPKFSKSKVNAILHDRSYLGFIKFRGGWHPGKHEPLADKVTWDKVSITFGEQSYQSHDLIFGSRLVRCGHCGLCVTGEEIERQRNSGTKKYVYYRCSRYRSKGHPQVRLPESELDAQIRRHLDEFADTPPELRSLIQDVTRSILESRIKEETRHLSESKRLLSLLKTQRQKLLSRNLSGDISDDLYTEQLARFDDQEESLKTQVERQARLAETIATMSKQSMSLFITLATDWPKLAPRQKRLALTALFGGFRLENRTLVPENRTPLELFRFA